MNICTQTSRFCRVYGDESGIEMLAKAGFESVDVSMFYAPDKDNILLKSDDEVCSYYENIRKTVERCGMYVYQTHTPFPVISDDLENNPTRFEMQRKALMASGLLGARHAIVHPSKFYPDAQGALQARWYQQHVEDNLAFNLKMFASLLPYLEKYNIKAAIENMFAWDPKRNLRLPTICSNPYELAKLVDDCNAMCEGGDRFVVCLDVGHTNLSCRDMSIRQIINILGPRLKALHIHDNNAIVDGHTAPGFGNIDWEGFCLGLKDIGYDGDFVYEADNFYNHFDPALLLDAGTMLYKIGRNMCEKYGL